MRSDPSLLFIVGMPRSGTKLLRDLLNRHPAVEIFPFESHWIPYFHSRFARYGPPTTPANFARFYRDFRRTTFHRRMAARGLEIDERSWFQELRGDSYGELLQAMFRTFARMRGTDVRIVGDKTPSYIREIPLLTSLFPDARFIHIVRDPRDYALSIHKAWGKNIRRAVQRWKIGVRTAREDAHRHHARAREVRYEDLLEAPDETLKPLCAFLGIPFHESMLELEAPSENIGDARGQRSVLRHNHGKWKQELDLATVAAIEDIAGCLMSELNYPVAYTQGDSDVGWMRMWWWQLADGANLLRARVRQQGTMSAGLSQTARELRYRNSPD